MPLQSRSKPALDARWIWLPGSRLAPDCHVLMRRTFELSAAPADASLLVTAGDQYRLYVNGRHVGDGPARSEVPLAYYDTYTSDELGLRKGRNVIALLVHSSMVAQHGQSLVPGGAWADLRYRPRRGRTTHVVTDAKWRVSEAPWFTKPAPRRFFPVGFNEWIDFGCQLRGWTKADFDDSAWQAAEVVPNEHYSQLAPRPMPRLRFDPWKPVQIRRHGNVAPLAGVFGLSFARCEDPPTGREVTFATFVHSDRKQKARFDFGCDNWARLRLNDELIWEQGRPDASAASRAVRQWQDYDGMTHGQGHRFEPGRSRGAQSEYGQVVVLHRGWNAVRVWLWRPETAYGFELTFLNADTGLPLPTTCSAAQDAATDNTWLRLKAEDSPLEDGTPVVTQGDVRPWLEPSHLADWDHQQEGTKPPKGAGALLAKPRGKTPLLLKAGQFIEYQLPADGAGFIDVELRGPKGTVVDVTISEAQTREGRIRSLYNGLWQTDRLILDGRWSRWLSLDRRAGRYLSLCVRQSTGPVEVRGLGLLSQHYPVQRPGTFTCSDETFTRMWQAGAATVDASTFDLIEDCPTREKAQWAGDAFIRLYLMAWLWGDVTLSANAIREFARDQKPDRWHRAMVPCGFRDVLVDTCFLLPRWTLDHYRCSGDLSVVEDAFEGIRNLFVCAEAHRDRRGFVKPGKGNTVYVDYTMPPVSRCGDTIGALQAQYLMALDAAVHLADIMHEKLLGRRWRLQSNRLRHRIQERFWVQDEGLFADGLRKGQPGGTFTAVTNYWMLFAGVPTAEQEAAMLKRLWPRSNRETMSLWSRGESPYSKFFVSEALLSRGLWRQAFAHWRAYYGTMLKHPDAWSVFEMWQRDWSLQEPVPRNSLVHAFGIGPLAHLACYVAGVRPLRPAFAEIIWEPMPGDLEWFKARLPLAGRDDMLEVEMAPDGEGRRLTLRVPPDITVHASERHLNPTDTLILERL